MKKDNTETFTESLKRLSVEETKHIQMEILDAVAVFCERHGIHYWLNCGTLLGAIRHKGYIPWDDDIDIGMMRKDFDKFIKTFNNENSRYKLICNELDPSCVYPYGKVLDTDTVLFEPDERGIKNCINIDVFVYDNAPDDLKERERMYYLRDRYTILNMLQNRMIGTHGIVKDMVKFIGYWGLKFFPRGYFASLVVKNSKRFADKETEGVGDFTSIYRMYCGKEAFSSFLKVEFEGKIYDAPIGYDTLLTAFYGDYMKLPPKELQVSHHLFKAYSKV